MLLFYWFKDNEQRHWCGDARFQHLFCGIIKATRRSKKSMQIRSWIHRFLQIAIVQNDHGQWGTKSASPFVMSLLLLQIQCMLSLQKGLQKDYKCRKTGKTKNFECTLFGQKAKIIIIIIIVSFIHQMTIDEKITEITQFSYPIAFKGGLGGYSYC